MADYHPDGRREQIHLTGPSLLPFFAAVGITIALLGLVWSWWFVGLGSAILLLTAWRWVQTVRLEIDSLPRK
jgi:hypothetical protein